MYHIFLLIAIKIPSIQKRVKIKNEIFMLCMSPAPEELAPSPKQKLKVRVITAMERVCPAERMVASRAEAEA